MARKLASCPVIDAIGSGRLEEENVSQFCVETQPEQGRGESRQSKCREEAIEDSEGAFGIVVLMSHASFLSTLTKHNRWRENTVLIVVHVRYR
jgi:hypothetical protein